MLEQLGAWAARRPEPRLWISVAGAGCLMAVSGLLAIAGDAQAEDGREAGSTTPGVLIFMLVVVAGYLLMHVLHETPAATAGVTAVVLGMPPLAWFLTFDQSDLDQPVSVEFVLGLPAAVWLVSYFVGPGRGRPLLLAAALIFGWLLALQVAEDPTGSGSLLPPLIEDDTFGGPFDGRYDDEFNNYDISPEPVTPEPQPPDKLSVTTIGAVSVVFGAGYFVAARLLDRRGHAGTATPFVVAGHIALPVGLAFLADSLEVAGTGVGFVIAGGLIAWLGAVGGRRLTTVVGALEIVFGLYLVVADAMEGWSAADIGVALFVLGGVIVGLAHVLHVITGESTQTTPGPSRFAGRPAPGAGGPWGPGAGGPFTPGGPGHPGGGPPGGPCAPWDPYAPGAPVPGAGPGGPYGREPAGRRPLPPGGSAF